MSPTPMKTSTATSALSLEFYEALRQVAAGKKITRPDWPDGECVFLHAGRLHLRKADGSLHQLLIGDGDLEATDWQVVREV